MLNMADYHRLARQAVAEGSVLLRNDGTLPLKKGWRIASFGRNQFNYYKSGTGSGGRVNAPYVVSILDALRADPDYTVDEALCEVYRAWDAVQPAPESGWAKEPWSLEEMPLTEELVLDAAARNDVAVIHLGRTAGEDRDNHAGAGSYTLSEAERKLLRLVCRCFTRTVVLLNVGNIIDMKWVEEFAPSAVLYVWQGGQEGGNGVMDVLTGRVCPSGRLTDTITQDISDHPATAHFGDPKENIYEEDIYVGYRYFETFAPEKVAYPFGFGLSYTSFSHSVTDFHYNGTATEVSVTVTNTGDCPGKDAVLLYVQAPQGKLGKPARALAAFGKTLELAPGESTALTLTCDNMGFASYDDSGVSGYAAAYVLEAGEYVWYIGGDVRSASVCGRFALNETQVVQQLSHAMSPVKPFRRLKPEVCGTGYKAAYEDTPLRKYDLWARIEAHRPDVIPFTGDLGYKLADVKSGKVSMEAFIGQIPEEDLFVLLRGEGMCSPKVIPGTGGAFGGVSPALAHLGIPIACCTDGPSGLRMDVGTEAVSLPNGTCLACSFNEELSAELFACTGIEMRKNHIDALLGPGMNIHRNPLNGRNFEYFSEDPLVTGKMAAAQLRGLHRHGVTGTIKHFAANNQEFRRYHTNSVISERALREIYLRGFQIACTEGGAFTIMSTYGPVNGLWTASNSDLLTHILRNEWGY
ncbi:MAG: glycoside hydrolase family 3 protein, partial [Clostridia bacterium]|nr:glycoside hydrolase family 3 protein [Clostridia bacterium]